MGKNFCSFGCGQLAIVQFKSSGNWCCSSHSTKCPSQREKDSVSKKGINPWINKPHPKGATGKEPWCKGLTAQTDPRIATATEKAKATKKLQPKVRYFHTEETKRHLSKVSGGWRPGSGSGIKGRYKGLWCDSSWELAFLLWCDIKSYTPEKVPHYFPYEWQGKTLKYMPDFCFKDDLGIYLYVEIKGYASPQWDAKLSGFKKPLLVLDSPVMKGIILPLIKSIYGDDFTRLYDPK